MNYSVAGLHSKGQRSLTFVTGSEMECCGHWKKWSWHVSLSSKNCLRIATKIETGCLTTGTYKKKSEFTHWHHILPLPVWCLPPKNNLKKRPNLPRLKATFEPRQSEWVIFSHLSTTCAALLQNPCESLANVSNLSHKKRQSQYAEEWRQIPDQKSHRKLSYVWDICWVHCKWGGKKHLIRYWVPHHYNSQDLNYRLNKPAPPVTLKHH